MGSSGESLKYWAMPPWIPMRIAPGKPSISARLILLFPGSLEIFTFEVWINFPMGLLLYDCDPLEGNLPERLEQIRNENRLSRFHKSGEQAARIFAVGNRILLSPKEFPGKEVEVRVERFERRGRIGGDQAVIDENFDVLPVEAKFSAQARLVLETPAG